jgi:hypothetical protein
LVGAVKSDGDYDNDGNIDGDDFLGWQSEFPPPATGAASVVPEPVSLVLLLVSIVAGVVSPRIRAD